MLTPLPPPARKAEYTFSIFSCSHLINVRDFEQPELFGMLELAPVQFWQHLVWMDTANFGGVMENTTLAASTPSARKRRLGRHVLLSSTPFVTVCHCMPDFVLLKIFLRLEVYVY